MAELKLRTQSVNHDCDTRPTHLSSNKRLTTLLGRSKQSGPGAFRQHASAHGGPRSR